MLLRISGWQSSSHIITKSCYKNISQFMVSDEFCTIADEIRNLIGIRISSNLS